MTTPHSHHLTRLAKAALKMPGSWAWSTVLRLRVATKRCSAGDACAL